MKENEFKLVISIIPLFTALIPIVTSFIKDKFARKWRCTRGKSALDKYMNHFLKVYWWSSVIFIVSIGVGIGVRELIENIVDIVILDEWSFAVASAVYILIIISWMNKLKIDSDKCELIRFKRYKEKVVDFFYYNVYIYMICFWVALALGLAPIMIISLILVLACEVASFFLFNAKRKFPYLNAELYFRDGSIINCSVECISQRGNLIIIKNQFEPCEIRCKQEELIRVKYLNLICSAIALEDN